MASQTVSLVLCLLALVHTDWVNIVSPWDTVALTGATADGAAASLPNMSSWIYTLNMPQSNWYAMAWVQVRALTANTARLLQLTPSSGGNSVEFYVTWTSTAVPTFTCGDSDHLVTGAVVPPNRQENVWIHILMGSQSGISFGYVTFRQNLNNQFSVTWTETLEIAATSTLKAPANANPFNVSST